MHTKTKIRIRILETKIRQVSERTDLIFPELIINFLERKIERLSV